MDRFGNLEPTPIWLTDPDYPAPCPCGRPMMNGEPMVMVQGEHGLKRMVHASCMASMMGGGDVEDA